MAHISEHTALQVALQYQQVIGQQLPQGEQIPPEVENQIAMMAAQAAQLLPKPENPDPQEAQAAQQAQMAEAARMKAEMDAERTRADIRRRDALSSADLQRKDAATVAEINRKAADQEARLLQQFISANAKAALKNSQSDNLPQVG